MYLEMIPGGPRSWNQGRRWSQGRGAAEADTGAEVGGRWHGEKLSWEAAPQTSPHPPRSAPALDRSSWRLCVLLLSAASRAVLGTLVAALGRGQLGWAGPGLPWQWACFRGPWDSPGPEL